MRSFLILGFGLLIAANSFAQVKAESSLFEKRNGIEFFALPVVFYNFGYAGFSHQGSEKHEHVVSFSSTYKISPRLLDFNLCYNFSVNLRKRSNYIPIWISANNAIREHGYEEGYFPDFLRFSLGTGYGHRFELNENYFFRLEFGAGAALNLTSTSGWALTHLKDYGFDQNYPQDNWPVIPSFRVTMSFNRKL